MQIRPILVALKKHRLSAVLIALEIALAFAVLCNACFLIVHRVAQMNIASGVDESSLGFIRLSGFQPDQAVDLNARVIAGLRAIPGVQSVSLISGVPFSGAGLGTRAGVTLKPDSHQRVGVPQFYLAGPGAFKALGLDVVAGRAPTAGDYAPIDDFVPKSASVLVTRALAEHMWPGQKPLGKVFWIGPVHFRVIGVVAHFARPYPPGFGPDQAQWSVFVPALPGSKFAGTYLIRTKPDDLVHAMTEAKAAIHKIAPDVVLDREDSHTIAWLRHAFLKTDRSMAGLLNGVIVALLGITAFGIVGLASFWVAQRRKQIGVRRALGATRADILRYFQTENFLIVSFGIVLGIILAIVINVSLMQFFEVPRLPLWYLPVGVVALWILGQLAVLAPALRASHVPPVVATRSV